MSVKNAKDFLDEILKSTNPEIHDFLEAEQGPYIPTGTSGGMTQEQIDELNLRTSQWLLGERPIGEFPGLPEVPEGPIIEIP